MFETDRAGQFTVLHRRSNIWKILGILSVSYTHLIEEVGGVKEVEFDDSEDHYKNSSAIYTVTLDSGLDNEREIEIEKMCIRDRRHRISEAESR